MNDHPEVKVRKTAEKIRKAKGLKRLSDVMNFKDWRDAKLKNKAWERPSANDWVSLYYKGHHIKTW